MSGRCLDVLGEDEDLFNLSDFFLGGLIGTGELLSSKVTRVPNRTLFVDLFVLVD